MRGPAEYAIADGMFGRTHPWICPGCYRLPTGHRVDLGRLGGVLAPRIVCPMPVLGPDFPRDERTLEPMLLELPYAHWEERWLFLAACTHLMATRRGQAEPIFRRFEERWPSGMHLLAEAAPVTALIDHFRPIGLWNMRAQVLLNVAVTNGGDPGTWTGYPREAWRVIAQLDTDVPAQDRAVEAWRRWAIHREVP